MTRESERSHLVIEGRPRTITNDAIWRVVRTYPDRDDLTAPLDALAYYRAGLEASRWFRGYLPGDLEFRLVREHSYQRQWTEALA